MTMYRKMNPTEPDGWTDWQAPVQNYKMACCDCGLVHDMQFKVIKVTETNKGEFNGDEVPFGDFRVLIRARRNNRSTGQLRRYNEYP